LASFSIVRPYKVTPHYKCLSPSVILVYFTTQIVSNPISLQETLSANKSLKELAVTKINSKIKFSRFWLLFYFVEKLPLAVPNDFKFYFGPSF
jgi:hypothetical protein